MVGAFDVAAELRADHLFAVTDAENGDFLIVNRRVRLGTRVDFDAGRAAGKDNGARGEVFKETFVDAVEGVDFAIDPVLAEAAGDELRHLAAEIDNQGAVMDLGVVGIELHVEPLPDSGPPVTPPFRGRSTRACGVQAALSGRKGPGRLA